MSTRQHRSAERPDLAEAHATGRIGDNRPRAPRPPYRADSSSGSYEQTRGEERGECKWELKKQAHPERRLLHHPPREAAESDPALQKLLQREPRERQQTERPGRQRPARATAGGIDSLAQECCHHDGAGNAGQERKPRRVPMPRLRQHMPAHRSLRVDEPIRECMRELRPRHHQRNDEPPRAPTPQPTDIMHNPESGRRNFTAASSLPSAPAGTAVARASTEGPRRGDDADYRPAGPSLPSPRRSARGTSSSALALTRSASRQIRGEPAAERRSPEKRRER